MLTFKDIELEITPATQHATAYVEGEPVATFARKKVLDKASPEWTCYDTDGRVLFVSHTGMGMRSRLANILRDREAEKRALKRELGTRTFRL